eukprot:TRINITY_DN32489_c0_g1_i4.p2 TRINITY_DN32489_c0_g1~~TRINITY_DN32489_c0_g1_i4.p2  ORF type:complete len:101 (-),score=7.25 TRINITY_DN32489_c0_g1_i4:478-780(-)
MTVTDGSTVLQGPRDPAPGPTSTGVPTSMTVTDGSTVLQGPRDPAPGPTSTGVPTGSRQSLPSVIGGQETCHVSHQPLILELGMWPCMQVVWTARLLSRV